MKVWVYEHSTLLSPPNWPFPFNFRLATNAINFRQPILADEVQTFKALITIHKVLQEGHPVAVKEAQANTSWLESLTRGISGEGIRGESLDSIGGPRKTEELGS